MNRAITRQIYGKMSIANIISLTQKASLDIYGTKQKIFRP